MFVRNLLQAGEYVTCVPLGIPVTLQYGEQGVIEKVLEFHNKEDWIDITDTVMLTSVKCKQIPSSISVKSGTTWVRGVYYTDKQYKLSGDLPECILSEMLLDYADNPDTFKFYAGDVYSLATTFRGATPIRQWLSLAGFQLLPGYVVPVDLTEESFESMVKRSYPFNYPMICSYILYHRDGTISYPSTQLHAKLVKSVDRDVDVSGSIFGNIKFSNGSSQPVGYSTIVRLNIQPKCSVICNSDGDVIHTTRAKSTKFSETVSNTISCSWCGRQIKVPLLGPVKCLDSHCNSRLYGQVLNFLDVLGLPSISFDKYKQFSQLKGNDFEVPDILEFEDYKDIKLDVSLRDLVRAIVPVSVVYQNSDIDEFVNACSSSPEVLSYYSQHPDKIRVDLDVNISSKLFSWLLDEQNVKTLLDLLINPHINITKSASKYKGAPIFKHHAIMITGTFRHGDLNTITEILESYDANVLRYYDKAVRCVVVGDLQENTNGVAIRLAKSDNVPVYTESEFFAHYDIDSDLAENL